MGTHGRILVSLFNFYAAEYLSVKINSSSYLGVCPVRLSEQIKITGILKVI